MGGRKMYKREKKVIVLEGASRKCITSLMTAFGKQLSSMGVRYIIPTCPTCISEENKAAYNILGLLPGGLLYDAIFDSDVNTILMDGFVYSYLARNVYKDYEFDDPRLLNDEIITRHEAQFDILLNPLYNKAHFYHVYLNTELSCDPYSTKEARLIENRFNYIFAVNSDRKNLPINNSGIVMTVSRSNANYVPRTKINYYWNRGIEVDDMVEIASNILMLTEGLSMSYIIR